MAIKVLDDAAQRVLQDAVKLINQRPPYSPIRPPFNPDSPSLDTNSTPEVYACKTPLGGLPGLSLAETLLVTGTSTFASEPLFQVEGRYCQVYQVDNIDGVLRQVPGNTPYVYNLSSQTIPENTWVIVVKDNYGDWFAIALLSPEDDVGTGTGTHDHIGGTPCDSLALLGQYDCLLISTTDPCGHHFETYLTYSGGHWTSEDIFCYIGGSGTFDFYYEAGRFHLTLDGKELLDCGTGCFTGAWITGHWAQPGDGILGTGTASTNVSNPQCNGPSFTICLECSCCPIDGWDGPGYYCIVDSGFTGTGTNSSDCEPVILDDNDKCDDTIIICSGPYDTLEEVLAACGDVIPTGTGVGSGTGSTISNSCCPDLIPEHLTLTISGATGSCASCANGVYSLDWDGFTRWVQEATLCGSFSLFLLCVSGTWSLQNATVASSTIVSISCNPFRLEFACTASGFFGMCSGTFTAVATH